MGRYAARCREMLAGPPEKVRLVQVGTPHSGYGNVFPPMIGGLAFALLTGRCLVIDFGTLPGWDSSPLRQLFKNPDYNWDWKDFAATHNVGLLNSSVLSPFSHVTTPNGVPLGEVMALTCGDLNATWSGQIVYYNHHPMGNIEKEQRGYTFQDPWYNPSGWAWLSRNIGPDPLKYSILYLLAAPPRRLGR